jgi:hypothetical protein
MRPALVPKSEPTYRLAPQYRPLPGERIDGDGATMAPFMERIHERKLAILMEHGPPRRARGPDGRFLPDSDPWPMLTSGVTGRRGIVPTRRRRTDVR